MTTALLILLALTVSAIVSVLVGRWLANQRAAQKPIDDYADQIRAAWESGAEPSSPPCPKCGEPMDPAPTIAEHLSMYRHCGEEVQFSHVIYGSADLSERGYLAGASPPLPFFFAG